MPEKLQNLLATNKAAGFDQALGAEAITRARQFMAGIRAYRRHPAQRDLPDMPVIWREGTTKLRDYNSEKPNAPVLIVIPSLINRFEILDLDFSHSFLRTVAAAGFRPLLVDWDIPGETEASFASGDYIARLMSLFDWVTEQTKQKPHILGYCMGGLLALGLAAHRADNIKTLSLFATPWDFHQPDASTGLLIDKLAADWDAGFVAVGQMPVDILHYLFTLLQPFQAADKFVSFAALDPNSLEARQFVWLEDWLNDGVPLPLAVARECLRDWYGKNTPATLQWRVKGHIVDPRHFTMPAYVVVPGRDRIVPPESAFPLAKLLPHATLHEPMTGHIGLMASRTAPHQVWKPLLGWLHDHQ